MTITVLAFYLFALVTVVAGLLVVISRNPVHSVLWLILAFFSSAGLFVLLGAEFVAMLLVIVYVGAVAVLFLFVVMMLDVDFAEMRGSIMSYLPVGLLIGVVLLVELGLVFGNWAFSPEVEAARAAITPDIATTENTVALGQLIYTKYIYL
ncbi:MAG: NADH-quinone oxidoreductase subunit J, partial [Alphaproteobacteria bacterium]|nr:NADH-quinone oxidoreductase subunit J [Alphaproteobacteria bacterium]